jgi:hypothetical protein
VGRVPSKPFKVGTRFYHDVDFAEYLAAKHSKGAEILQQSYAPMTLESVYKDADKYSLCAQPIHVDEELLAHVVSSMSSNYLDVFGTYCSVALNSEKAFNAFPLSTSSTADGAQAGPTKGHLLAQYIQHGGDSILAQCADWVDAGCPLTGWPRVRTEEGVALHDTISGKDEIRPMDKLGKTRAFIVPSIYSYVGEYYMFSDFMTKYQQAALRRADDPSIPFAGMLGVPAQLGGYHRIIGRFLTRAHKIFLDHSKWDGRIWELLFRSAGEVFWNLLVPWQRTRENRQRLDNLIRLMYSTPVTFPDGTQRVRAGGMPSGVFVTLLFNSIINEMLFHYVYMRINGKCSVSEVFERVMLMVMGDDINIASMCPIPKLIEEYGLAGFVVSVEDDETFCSHRFKNTKGVWHLAASPDRVLASMYLKSTSSLASENPLASSLGRACSLLCEAFQAGCPTGFDVDVETILRDYISHVCRKTYDGKPFFDSKVCQDVLQSYFDEFELEVLVLGSRQGVVKAARNAQAPPYIEHCVIWRKGMSKQITKDLSPGTASQQSAPSAKRSQRDDSARALVEKSGVAGGSRLSVLRQHIFDSKACELDYLKCLLYPCEENKVGIPDLGTTVPTAKYCFRNAGTVTTDGAGDFLVLMTPLLRTAVFVVTGSTDYGYQYGADGVTKRSSVQLADLVANAAATGYRRVGRRLTVKFLEALTETQGQIAYANMVADPTSGVGPGNLADVIAVPGAFVGTAAELFKDGSFSIPLLTEAVIQGTTGLPYNEQAFIELAYDFSQSNVNYIAIAGSGLPTNTAVLQLDDLHVIEVTTNSVLIPTTPNGGSIKGLHASMQLAQHPRVVTEAHHPEGKPTPLAKALNNHENGIWNWLGSAIKQGENFGSEVASLVGEVADAASMIVNGVEKAAPYAASVAPLLML